MRDLVRRYGVNRPAGQLLRGTPTRATSNFFFRFNPKRRAFEGARQAPLRKAINYALDRPALTRAHPYLTVRRSDRLLPGALSESRRLYPLAEPDLDTALRLLARAGRRPPTLTLYTWNFAFGLPSAQVFVSNLNEIGIEVKVKPFDLGTLVERLETPGEPWDVALLPLGGVAYPDPAAVLVPLLRGTRYEARIDAANRVRGATARARAWADLEADLMRNDPPVAAYANGTGLVLVSRSFGCWIPERPSRYGLDLGAVCKK